MSCINPDCPVHGDNADARENSELWKMVTGNSELMDVIRVIAANQLTAMAAEQGIDPNSRRIRDIGDRTIDGLEDHEPPIRGAVGAFVMMLKNHPQVQQFAGLLADVPKEQGHLLRMKKEADREYAEHKASEASNNSGVDIMEIPGLGYAVSIDPSKINQAGSVDNLMAMLFGAGLEGKPH